MWELSGDRVLSGLSNFGLITFVLLCYANEAWRHIFQKYSRPVKYWAFFAGSNRISRLRKKKSKEYLKFSKIRRILISRNSIQKGYHSFSDMA